MTYPNADPLAEAVMVAYCGWNPLENVQDGTVLVDGNGAPIITLPSLYVTDVSAVAVDGHPPLTVGSDVTWGEDGVLTWCRHGYWPVGQRNITVTYSSGYAANPPVTLIAALNSVSKRIPTMQSGYGSTKMGTASATFNAAAMAGELLCVESMVFDSFRIMKAA